VENKAQIVNMAVANPAADEVLNHAPVPRLLAKRNRTVQITAEQFAPEKKLSKIDRPEC
jgi:hypothetical protein